MVPGEIEHVIQSQHPRRNLSEVHRRIHMILHKHTQTQAWSRGNTHSSRDSMTRIVITQRVSHCILSSWVEIRLVLNWFHCSNCWKSPWFRNRPVYSRWMTKTQQAFCKCYDCDIGSLCSTVYFKLICAFQKMWDGWLWGWGLSVAAWLDLGLPIMLRLKDLAFGWTLVSLRRWIDKPQSKNVFDYRQRNKERKTETEVTFGRAY